MASRRNEKGRHRFVCTAVITEQVGKLVATAAGQPKEALIPEPDGSFFTIDEGVEITFLEDDTGRITGLSAAQAGHRFTMKRVEQSSTHVSPSGSGNLTLELWAFSPYMR
jgi:hypothetical protein